MDIRSLNPVSNHAPVSPVTPSQEQEQAVRQLVTAIREVNKSELLGQGREIAFRRDPETRQPVIQIIDQDSGDVISQLPPETVLSLAAQLDRQSPEGDS